MKISILSAHAMYKISAKLSKVLNMPDKPFGGKNMIFAGDFGQLPLPMGGEHVSLYSNSIGKYRTSLSQQEEAMGIEGFVASSNDCCYSKTKYEATVNI